MASFNKTYPRIQSIGPLRLRLEWSVCQGHLVVGKAFQGVPSDL